MEKFYTILTKAGEAKIANSIATGNRLVFKHIALGDSFGLYYEPSRNATALKNEVWRGDISLVRTRPDNPNWLNVEAGVPASDGGFIIREAGIYDASGELIAIGKYPETEKPALESGTATDLYIRMVIEVGSEVNVEVVIDPNVVVATKPELRELESTLLVEIEKKSDKTYVDSELLKRETITNSNTKFENSLSTSKAYVDNKVKTDVPFNAKFTDTVVDISGKADKTYVDTGLSGKVDKVIGKTLTDMNYTVEEKNKLSKIEAEATKYIHPVSHSATMITETSSRRFVSDTDKPKWDAVELKADKLYVDNELGKKETLEGSQIKANTALENAKIFINNKVKTDVPIGAIFTDTVYSHPATHSANMIVESPTKRFVTDADKEKWNQPAGLDENAIKLVKVNSAVNADTVNGKTVLENVPSGAKFTDTVYSHPSSHPASIITGLSNVATTGNYAHLSGIPKSGSSTFSGNGTERAIVHGLGSTPSSAFAVASANPEGYLGEVWIRITSTHIYVGNSGSFTGAMNWTVMP